MHCDHKLGLSLGVLIVGFAAALCFPRHRDREAVSLELDGAADLDHEIALLPVRAYTEQEAALQTPAEPIAPEPEAVAFDHPVSGEDDEQLDPFAGPPESIATGNAPGTVLETAVISPDAVAVPEALEEYTVQSGDTLSGLAARFLGSHSRYLELYEANRDILSSPDDLQPQMRLRIPSVAVVVENAPAAQHNDRAHLAAAGGTPAAPVPADAPDQPQPNRFQPAGRRPFIPPASIPSESVSQ